MRPVRSLALVGVVAALTGVGASSPAVANHCNDREENNIACDTSGSRPDGPRDGAVQQAMVNTFAASLQRRGYELNGVPAQASIDRFNQTVQDRTEYGATVGSFDTAPANRTFHNLIIGLAGLLPWPLNLGKEGQGFHGEGGSYGGAGSTHSWEPNQQDCGDIDFKFDASGNLIIPSYSLSVGGPMSFGDPIYRYGDTNKATSKGAALRWGIHKWNIANKGGEKKSWAGVVSFDGTSVTWATVAYRRGDGTLVPRAQTSWSAAGPSAMSNTSTAAYGQTIECPGGDGTGGGNVHYYGSGITVTGGAVFECTAYAPDESLGQGGYAINTETSIPFNLGQSSSAIAWPKQVPEFYKTCSIDPQFIEKLTEAVNEASQETVCSDCAPYGPVKPEDARPGDTIIEDLEDPPTEGETAPPPDHHVDDPPPTPTPTPTPSPGVDLGPDPGIGSPTLDEPPTGIMDPIFDWLPDLPSIQLNVGEAPCPVWEAQPFPEPEWHLVFDDHCPFLTDNQALISTIMMICFTVGAAMIILRA